MLDEENYNFKTKKKIVPQNTKNKKKKTSNYTNLLS